MSGQSILVTGATGFTGGHLSERLAAVGHRVRALVRNPTRADDLRRWGVEVVPGDLRDVEAVKRAARGVETIYHVAAVYRQAKISRPEMWAINVGGTKNLLDAAIGAGVRRFVHCSSIGVHGGIANGPANEETPYGPGDEYQESKADAERLVLQYLADGRIQGVIFRPAGIYGPRDLRFLKLFKAIKRRRFVMLGSGLIHYHMIYIDDLVDGILLCGTSPQSLGGVYILGGESPVTLNDLAALIAEAVGVKPPRLRFPVAPVYYAGLLCEWLCKPLGVEPPLYRRRVDFFRKNRAFDVSKAKRELGFRPATDLKTGIALTAQWYRNQGLL